MKMNYLILISILLGGLWMASAIQSESAMTKCQETNSHDTCFWNINR